MLEVVEDPEGLPSCCKAVGTEMQAHRSPPDPAQRGSSVYQQSSLTTGSHQPISWGDLERVTQPISCFQMGELSRAAATDLLTPILEWRAEGGRVTRLQHPWTRTGPEASGQCLIPSSVGLCLLVI